MRKNWKKLLSMVAAGALFMLMFAGCGHQQEQPEPSSDPSSSDVSPMPMVVDDTIVRVASLKGPTAVSYTHLDVYKRQRRC